MERTIHVGQLEKLITSSKQYSEPWTFLSVLMSHDASPFLGTMASQSLRNLSLHIAAA